MKGPSLNHCLWTGSSRGSHINEPHPKHAMSGMVFLRCGLRIHCENQLNIINQRLSAMADGARGKKLLHVQTSVPHQAPHAHEGQTARGVADAVTASLTV